jgi:hypothetical protein
MNRTQSPAKPANEATAASDSLTALNRTKFAFLDEYVYERRGYDPYDTSKDRSPDIWKAKPKRA